MAYLKILKRGRMLGLLASLAAATMLLMACGSGSGTSSPSTTATVSAPASPLAVATSSAQLQACPPAGSAMSLTGAGATFPFPLYSKWFDEYKTLCKVEVNYQSVGSGAGIRQISEQTVDFGGSDAVMTDEQKAGAKGGKLFHIPTTLGAVAVIYNLPGIQSGQVKLSGDTLSAIYLGDIKKWSDPKIKADNPNVSLPDADIAVVRRSDGSGTSFIFTSYLSAVSAKWKSSVGANTSVEWPGNSIGGQGNEGVAGAVRNTPGGIGYVEIAYAKQNKLTWAQLKNKSGAYVEPTPEATTAAVEGVTIPDNAEIVVVDSADKAAYPITGFTWLLVYENYTDKAKATAVATLAWWMTHDAQKSQLEGYAPISHDVQSKVEAMLKQVKSGGQPVLSVR